LALPFMLVYRLQVDIGHLDDVKAHQDVLQVGQDLVRNVADESRR
jgi:hypothetical protein